MHCSIHTNIHPMLGLDLHNGVLPAVPPAPPVPVPFMPHIVAQVLGGLNFTAAITKTVHSHNFLTVQRGSDIGPFIGHVPMPANILLPLLYLGSGSVCEFGAFSVLSEGKAIAIAPLIYAGFNYNCYDPVPWNTNLVIAPGCNMAGFNFADFFASLVSVAFDLALSFVTGKVAEGIAGQIASRVSLGNAVLDPFVNSLQTTEFLGNALEYTVGLFTGSPLGYDISALPGFGGNETDELIDTVMNEYYQDGPLFN